MAKVLLINMPFSSANWPQIGLALLKGGLRERGIVCDVRNLQLLFAREIGQNAYFNISQFAPRALLGDWLFSHHVFGEQLPDQEEYFDKILRQAPEIYSEEFIAQLPEVREKTGPYLDLCLEQVAWQEYDLIGFTSTFAQNLASLALAKRIKEAWPEKVIVFGGANCEGEMGVELCRQFPYIDYVCSGESDLLFAELVGRLEAGGEVNDLEGLIYRRGGEVVANGSHARPVMDLDGLPLPDYDDYFEQLEESGLAIPAEQLRLMVETARGCWWGAKSQCIFCGLNNQTLEFRSKSSRRALEEFSYLAEKYPDIRYMDATDKIMDRKYFKEFLPALAQRNLGINIFYFTKSNLSKEEMSLLREAGVKRIQPGIESLNTSVLKIMRKGCNSLQNIQLLKWAGEIGLEVIWNFIYGFPGEDEAAYQQMLEIIPAITHLQPPSGDVNHVRLDRFSPYFLDHEALGMTNIRPAAAYSFVYPIDEESLSHLAYYFDFDYTDGRLSDEVSINLKQAVQSWHQQADQGALLSLRRGGQLILFDTRPGADQREIVLEGVVRSIYEYCDEGRTLESILRFLHGNDGPPVMAIDEVSTILESLADQRVMLYLDNHYLGLAIPMDKAAQAFIENIFELVGE